METNRKLFLLTYGTHLMDGYPLQKYLEKMTDTTSSDKVLPGEYYLPVDVGEHT